MNYMNEEHELLHKLFVLQSNDYDVTNFYLDEYSLNVIISRYPFQMSDRSNADDIFSADMYTGKNNKKITFSFSEDE